MPVQSAAEIPVTRSPGVKIPAPAWAAVGAILVALVWIFWPDTEPIIQSVAPKQIVQRMTFSSVLSGADISRQGDKIVLLNNNVVILDLNTGETRVYPVSGIYLNPEFSDDGTSVLLTGNSSVARLSLLTGSLVPIVETNEGGPRANWRNDEFIVFEENQSIYEASLTTGETRLVASPDSSVGEFDMDWPLVLPGGDIMVATVEIRPASSKIGFWDIDSGKKLAMWDIPGNRVQWMEPGYLVFHQGGQAVAVPFDIDSLERTGPIVTLAQNIREEGLSISSDGTMIHTGTDFGVMDDLQPVTLHVFSNEEASLNALTDPGLFPAARYRSVDVHPDGKRAAVVIVEASFGRFLRESDIWVLDFEQGTRRAMTRGGQSDYPSWNAAGDSLYFVRTLENDDIMVMATDGRGGEKLVYQGIIPVLADLTLSPDGKWMAYAGGIPPTINQSSNFGLRSLGQEVVFLDTPNENARQFSFSSNSKYVAYEDAGAIFVQSLEDLDSPPYPVWESAVSSPKWAPDDSRIFALGPSGSVHSVEVETEPVFSVLSPPIVDMRVAIGGRILEIFPDGKRFVLAGRDPDQIDDIQSDSSTFDVDIHFIINVPELLNN